MQDGRDLGGFDSNFGGAACLGKSNSSCQSPSSVYLSLCILLTSIFAATKEKQTDTCHLDICK